MTTICKQTRETIESLKKVIKFVHLKHDITKHGENFNVKVRENCKTTVNSINDKKKRNCSELFKKRIFHLCTLFIFL
jgi:hypothetical protein